MSRAPTSETPSKYAVKKLSERGRHIIRCVASGWSVSQVSEMYGVHRTTVSRIIHSAPGREEMARCRAEMDEVFLKMSVVEFLLLCSGGAASHLLQPMERPSTPQG